MVNVKGRGGNVGVGFVFFGVDEVGLGFDDGFGFVFVVDIEDFGVDFEFLVGGGGREGFEEFEEVLVVDDVGGVEDGDVGDGD